MPPGKEYDVPINRISRSWLGMVLVQKYRRGLQLVIGLSCLTMAGSLSAATVLVNSLADSGPGSLRAAISNAVAGDTIRVTAQGTLLLASGLLEINKNLTITGPGTNHLTLDAQGLSSIFSIPSGVTAVISDLTLTNGFNHFLETSLPGGAIRNFGSLTLHRCVVANSINLEGFGGAIGNTGSLTLNDCVLQGNGTTFTYGGGVASLGTAAILTMNRSAVVRNGATHAGGVYAEGTTLIRDSTIAENRVDNGSAGIFSSGSTTIIGSCIAGNRTRYGMGAGIGAAGRFLLLSNCTVTGNTTADNSGGGIWSAAALARLESCTITLNRCDLSEHPSAGGGLFVASGVVRCHNTIIARNFSLNAPDCSGTLVSDGYNLIQDPSGCTFLGATNGLILGLEARLGPLQDNGGPTLSHALLPTSPAVDAGSPTNFPPIDQRGFPRAKDGDNNCQPTCDLGAVESEDRCQPFFVSFSFVSATRVLFQVGGCPGATYAVQGAPSTAAGTWTTIVTGVADSSGFYEEQTFLPAASTNYFFRVEKVCPP